MEANQPQDSGLMIDSVFSKSYGPTNSNLMSNYQTALNELKMKCKKSNNTSSRGRKSGIKLNPNVKIQNHQATVCNSNTSRKTPIHNTKFVKLNQLKIKNSKCEDIGNKELHKPIDINMTQSLLKLIKGRHNNIPKAGVHYRARTTEIGNQRHIKANIIRKVNYNLLTSQEQKFKSSGRCDNSTPRKSSSRSQRKSHSRKRLGQQPN